MRLVSIESAEENAAILSAVAPLHSTLFTAAEDQAAIWLSAQDIAVEGTWRWGASGPTFWLGDGTGSAQNGAYTNWSTGKPNNSATGSGEDCGVLYLGAGAEVVGAWNDLPCYNVHAFLCEQTAP